MTAAVDYVRQYEEELTSVVARETYRQNVRIQIPRVESEPLTRTLTSEVFFMFVERQGWMAIRDVLKVDDAMLEPRPDLRRALAELPASQVAARFKAYNARYNIGRIRRNFNEPTLALAVLSDRHRARFGFERVPPRRGDDLRLVTLAFRERTAPTLIRGLTGENVFSSGQITLDPATGRITATRMAMKIGSIRVELAAVYAHDPRLEMAVPVSFSEHYLDGAPPRDASRRSTVRHEEILCEARYSDFQRFAVQTRIK
ncbi:MAG: hypothetical protein H0X44_01045 [Acidobacteria bacterium]|nr:hypothetical protein [Acidobacteriota bacterium]